MEKLSKILIVVCVLFIISRDLLVILNIRMP